MRGATGRACGSLRTNDMVWLTTRFQNVAVEKEKRWAARLVKNGSISEDSLDQERIPIERRDHVLRPQREEEMIVDRRDFRECQTVEILVDPLLDRAGPPRLIGLRRNHTVNCFKIASPERGRNQFAQPEHRGEIRHDRKRAAVAIPIVACGYARTGTQQDNMWRLDAELGRFLFDRDVILHRSSD